ncbi:MAG TPA: hypothetical protein PKK21_03310 [Bacilli bacterium]|nr:hypothetical protein [Bacilli bacterium]
MNEENKEIVEVEKPEEPKPIEEPKIEEVPLPELEIIEYDTDNLKNIEAAREIFLKQYKVQNIVKWIVSVAALALIIVGWLVFLDISVYLTIGTVGASLLLILLYNFFIKRYLNDKMKIYFDAFYKNTTDFIFEGADYADVEFKVESKIEPVQFTENEIYKDVVQVGSRNLTTYKYKGMPISVCDAAGQTKGAKQLVPVFVGKYFMAENSYDHDEPIIVYLKGNEKSLPPTNVEHLNVISDDKQVAVYSNNADALKYLNKKVMTALKKISTDDVLIDVAIAIRKGKTFVCAGYDDVLMVLPLEKPFNPKATRSYKDDLVTISEFIYTIK